MAFKGDHWWLLNLERGWMVNNDNNNNNNNNNDDDDDDSINEIFVKREYLT